MPLWAEKINSISLPTCFFLINGSQAHFGNLYNGEMGQRWKWNVDVENLEGDYDYDDDDGDDDDESG